MTYKPRWDRHSACQSVFQQPDRSDPSSGQHALHLTDRALIIATFIALLELIRRGEITAWQEERPGPIYLCRGPRFGSGATEREMAAIERDGTAEGEIGDG